MVNEILMFCFINVFLFVFGCIIADLISDEIKMRKLNKKIKIYRNEYLRSVAEKIKNTERW